MALPLAVVAAPLITAAGGAILAGAGIGISWFDKTFNGGRFVQGIVTPAISNVFEAIGDGQQNAQKEVGRHGFGKLLDVLGEGLATFFGPNNGFSKWLRNKGQDLMGVPEGQREFGSATDTFTAGQVPPQLVPTEVPATQTPGPMASLSRVPNTGTPRTEFASVSQDVTSPLQGIFRGASIRLATGPEVSAPVDLRPSFIARPTELTNDMPA